VKNANGTAVTLQSTGGGEDEENKWVLVQF